MSVLEVKKYSAGIRTSDGRIRDFIHEISFQLNTGEAVGIVGESGCGKSMLGLSVMRLLPQAVAVQAGAILLATDKKEKDILKLSPKELSEVRGKEISMIFQEPMSSLNPVLTVGRQLDEGIRLHGKRTSAKERKKKVLQMLTEMGFAEPEKCYCQYPHELSGGMRQRVMIAMALVNSPDVIIADEPTTALDVTVQAQILKLLKKIKNRQTALIFISHNIGVISEICDRVLVMYAGCIVEEGSCEAVFSTPVHPYTSGLIRSIPAMDKKQEELFIIPGTVPGVEDLGDGCRFASRCSRCMARCRVEIPPMRETGGRAGHRTACWLR